MESKPIVTCHGDQALFSALHPIVLQGLPKDVTEWRRSHGRPPKNIKLDASFVPYDDDILPNENDRTLISRPYFHVYWTDCDLDSYKQTVRDELGSWSSALKRNGIPDWLIVVVVRDESKVKSKLLPRSSVIDKVKNDFCSKHPERCIVLTEPMKNEPKTKESWANLFHRLRQLLLQAFNRNLSKFEENMRALREKRNDPDWRFCDYFVVQEELAFMFEMLGIYDDALIQYDELDALFTQFVLNQAAGDTADWLSPFGEPCSSWMGLSLQKAIDWNERNQLKDNKASLLDLRNYLFSRQCALLFLLGRPWEVAQRELDFLHNTVQELQILEVTMPEGSVACWVFLSCLEVLETSDKYSDADQSHTYSSYTAGLWDYARRKLQELGQLCGLMPGDDLTPSSKQLDLVVNLLSGLGSSHDDKTTDADTLSPIQKLREALSSKEAFQKHYLELSEFAMGTFKHIGRFRSARLIGKDLADFYLKQGHPQKAEGFLLDALKMYRDEGWEHLVDGTQLEIARCQQMQANPLKYVKTAISIVSSRVLSQADRSCFLNEVFRIAEDRINSPFHLRTFPAFSLDTVTINNSEVVLGTNVTITLEITNHFPSEITCQCISLALVHNLVDATGHIEKLRLRHTSSTTTHDKQYEYMVNYHPNKKLFPTSITLAHHHEWKEKIRVGSGIMCDNPHLVLHRSDSGPGIIKEPEITKADYDKCVSATSVTLQAGVNTVLMTAKTDATGMFRLSQLCIKLQGLEFLKMVTPLSYQVICRDPIFDVAPSKSYCLMAGILQELTVTLHAGTYNVESGSLLKFESNKGMKIIAADTGDSRLILDDLAASESTTFRLHVYLDPNSKLKQVSQRQICFEVTWLNKTLSYPLVFEQPLRITHKIYTSKEKKYFQVLVNGTTENKFTLSSQTLTTNCQDCDLLPLNKPGQEIMVDSSHSASYIWQLKPNIDASLSLDLTFTVTYKSTLDEDRSANRQYSYAFKAENFKTLMTASVSVHSDDDQKQCYEGSSCTLHIHVKKMDDNWDCRVLSYEVLPDKMWAVNGKTTGLFTLQDGLFETNLSVMPLVAGYLPLPGIKVFKCVGTDSGDTEDIWTRRVQETEHDGDSESDEVSDNTPSPADPRDDTQLTQLEQFQIGQIYYSSIAKQFHVYPNRELSDVEINVAV